MKIIVNGAAGRMGRAVIAQVAETPGAVLAGALERAGHEELGRPVAAGVSLSADAAATLARGEVVIDFSLPPATLACLEHCLALSRPLVIGTTGFSDRQRETVIAAAAKIPVLFSPNMSLGVNVLFSLAARAAALLPGYQAEIVEVHHERKIDAPSGTAVRLGEIVAAAAGGAEMVYGRRGASGPRRAKEIGIHAVRLGEVVGEHTLILAGPGERLELVHRAASRDNFARGAVAGALFLAGRGPGLYTMSDVLEGMSDETTAGGG